MTAKTPRGNQVPTSVKVLRAAAALLDSGGVEAVSTRAVAAAAGVQAPVIYREFGDKEGLLDAVTAFVLENYMRDKRSAASSDPVQDLRQLWDLHVAFGLSQPECYVLAYGVIRAGKMGTAAKESFEILRGAISRVGHQGRLRMSVDSAAQLAFAAGVGFALSQICLPADERDPQLSLIAREHALTAFVNDTETPEATMPTLTGRAVALREALRDDPGVALTRGERVLMAEWLNRLADNSIAAESAEKAEVSHRAD
jgi:AcrR family transcriptional regulator